MSTNSQDAIILEIITDFITNVNLFYSIPIEILEGYWDRAKVDFSRKKAVIKYNKELLDSYCKENGITLIGDYTGKITRESKIKGYCSTAECKGVFEKSFRPMYTQSGAYCKECTKKRRREKVKATCLERYGVEYSLQSKEVRDKGKATNLERYGVEYPSQSEEVKDKGKATCLERYGVEYPSQSEEFKDKVKATNLERRGVEYSLQSKEVRDKIKATNLERYGVEHSLQSEEIRERLLI